MQANSKLLLTLLLTTTSACSVVRAFVPIGGSTADADADRNRKYEAEKAERARLADGRPAWCKDFEVDVDVNLDDFKSIDQGYMETDAGKFAKVMCAATGKNHDLKPKVMEIRAAWMKRHGMDERDFLAAVDSGKEQDYETFAGPVGQIPQRDGVIELDVWGPRTSMLARAAFIKNCFGEGRSDWGHESETFIRRVICTREPLDVAKANAEIEAEKKLDPWNRYHLRQMVFNAKKALDAARADVAVKAKEDPGIAQMIVIADAQRKEWESVSPERQKLISELETMEAATAANKRSGFAGCEDTTRAAWAAQVQRFKPEKGINYGNWSVLLPAIFNNADAFLAHRALELCVANAGGNNAIHTDSLQVRRRGPRTATFAALIAARDTIKFDNKDNDGLVPRADFWIGGRMAEGTVATLTPKNGKVVVAFKPELYKREDCVQAKETGNIDYVSNGQIYYKKICLKTAMVEHDSSPDDVEVDAFWAKGLKPGMYLYVTEGGYPMIGLSKREGTPTWVLGAPLK
jgi:hypothetical protein